MLAIIAFWAGLACGAVVLIRHVYKAVQPPDVIGSAMSDEWLTHATYQLSKPGGAMEQYGEDGQ